MSEGIHVNDVSAGYHRHAVVHRLNLMVQPGEVVTLLGPNGAGKTTSLLTIAGEIETLGGSVSLDGKVLRGATFRRAREGLGFVTFDRSVFPELTTLENLRVGRGDIDWALESFPELRPRLRTHAGLLSGGEQRMLVVARMLSRFPRYVLADELSLGLAPKIVDRIFATLRDAASERGLGVLLAEQNVRKAMGVASRVYVMTRGSIVLEGGASEVAGRVEDVYLGRGKEK